MVRPPCPEKRGLKKGAWTPEEDQKLMAYIEQYGHGSWKDLPAKAGLQRCGKSCRLRWINYLRPDIKRGEFSLQEEQTIIQLHALLGNKWSAIAAHLPKRTDNEIKNYWHTHIKKRLDKMGIDPLTHKPKPNAFGSIIADSDSREAAHLSHMAQWESTRLEAEARLVRESKLSTNPLHNQFSFISTPNKTTVASAATSPTSIPAPPPPIKPKCFDVLKAWQGMVSGVYYLHPRIGESLESPTSTLNFTSENGLATGFKHDNSLIIPQIELSNNSIPCKGQMINEENAWNCIGQVKETVLDVQEIIHSTYNNNNNNNDDDDDDDNSNGWGMDSFMTVNEDINGINFVNGLSDIMIYNNHNISIDHHHHHGSSSSMAGENNGPTDGNIIKLDQDQISTYWSSLINFVDVQTAPSGPVMF